MSTLNEGPGRRVWAFAAGHIPLYSTGKEPAFTSHDKIAILNGGDRDAEIRITVFYEDEMPQGEYVIHVRARRVRKIRFNDLIDPLPVPLDKPFGFLVRSQVSVIVQFSRMDTGSRSAAAFCVTAFSERT